MQLEMSSTAVSLMQEALHKNDGYDSDLPSAAGEVNVAKESKEESSMILAARLVFFIKSSYYSSAQGSYMSDQM